MKKIEENKAITLVALVITIIILLILAGVTISFIFGNDGIITRAQSAVENYKEAENVENEAIAKVENYIVGFSRTEGNSKMQCDVLTTKTFTTNNWEKTDITYNSIKDYSMLILQSGDGTVAWASTVFLPSQITNTGNYISVSINYNGSVAAIGISKNNTDGYIYLKTGHTDLKAMIIGIK